MVKIKLGALRKQFKNETHSQYIDHLFKRFNEAANRIQERDREIARLRQRIDELENQSEEESEHTESDNDDEEKEGEAGTQNVPDLVAEQQDPEEEKPEQRVIVGLVQRILNVPLLIASAVAAVENMPMAQRCKIHTFCSSSLVPYYHPKAHRGYCSNYYWKRKNNKDGYHRCMRVTRLICIQCSFTLSSGIFFCCKDCRNSTDESRNHGLSLPLDRYNLMRHI
jgi:hypothetical protein